MEAPKFHLERGLLSGAHTDRRPGRTCAVEHSVRLAAPPEEVFDFCLSETGFTSIMPYRVRVLGQSAKDLAPGESVAFSIYLAKVLPIRWVAYLDEVNRPQQFVDLQTRGIFRYFRHTHSCRPDREGTHYTDHVEYATRLGPLLDRTLIKAELNRMFRHRHRRMAELLGERQSP
ncbi:polyketide cyclase/dehydrase [Thermobifida alba]|uniref:Polyketide cyclase/dehydrase n=1 Tax=Thermobifida alba TaxID=53522 RepID=A0ABY4L7F4_THEAE|nr:polyketide cyclase/dehydrase [Thermobifida alba]UPT23215.1 polyketide cyclase/dehydrase [Thermobifida alba]